MVAIRAILNTMSARGVLLGLLAAAAIQPQDLAPEVLLLSQMRRHVREELQRLPDFTCQETTRRVVAMHRAPEEILTADSVLLEVLFTGQKEMYASPGERTFHAEHQMAFAGSGLTANGVFAMHLNSVLGNNNATFTWRGEDRVGERKALRWDYRIPIMLSGYILDISGASATVSMKGSLWADPDTLDVLRLDIEASDIPPNFPAATMVTRVTYSRIRVGSHEVMAPETGEVLLVSTDGQENRNHMVYSGCRTFESESSVTFGPAQAEGGAAPAALAKRDEVLLPENVSLRILLETPITEKDAVGMLIAGRLGSAVAVNGTKTAPVGATVRGRIRRLEYHSRPMPYFAIGIEYFAIELEGVDVRFRGELDDIFAPTPANWSFIKRGSNQTVLRPGIGIAVPPLAGVGSLFVRGNSFTLPRGFRSQWMTRAAE
jgi:hypothetical protein